MNLKIFNKPDKTGKFSRRKYLEKNYPSELAYVDEFSLKHDLSDLKFSQQIWHLTNNVTNIPLCKNSKCNKHTNFKNRTLGYNRYCSNSCQSSSDEIKQKRKKTSLERYGVEIAQQSYEVKQKTDAVFKARTKTEQNNINKKREETTLQNFGVKNIANDKEIIQKRVKSFKANIDQFKDSYKKTSLERYGVEHPWQNKDIHKKTFETYKKETGYSSPQLNPEVKDKTKQTNLKKYNNEWQINSSPTKEKTKKTNLERYGVDNVFKLDEVQEKILEKAKETNLERYGVEKPFQSKELRVKATQSNKEHYLKKMYDSDPNIVDIDYENKEFKYHCPTCDTITTMHRALYYYRKLYNVNICIECNPIKSYSGFEREVQLYLDELGIDYITNDRKLISPLELDIYIPSLNIAIECNGVYWHSELFKNESYHQDKFFSCKEKDIRLVQIWQDDWVYKCGIIKSRLLNILKIGSSKIFARQCNIQEVSNLISKEFLDVNHLQGSLESSIRIGLYYNDELVSLMVFGKLRKSLGSKSGNFEFELYRFCSKLNIAVVGSASKLFKHFINVYSPISVISYAQLDWSLGELYQNLDMQFDKYTTPSYYYIIDGIKSHRFNWTKHKLVEKGYDKALTEREIMYEMGHYRVWNSGNAKWIWTKK